MVKNQRLAGIAMSYISVGIGFVTTILYTPIMIQMVGEVEYGIYSWALGIIQNLSLFQMGLYAAFTRFHARCKAKNDVIGLARLNALFLSLYIVIALIAFGCGMLLISACGTIIAYPAEIGNDPTQIAAANRLMLLMVFNICITFPTYIFESNILVNERFIVLRAITIFRQLFNPMICLPLLMLGWGNISLSFATMIITLVTSLVYMVYCFRVLRIRFQLYVPKWKELKEVFGFSFYILINLVVDQVNWSLDRILLGSLVSASAVTIYSMADQLSRYFFNFSSMISDVYTPKIHRIVAMGSNNDELTHVFTQVARVQFMVLSLVIMGFFGVGEYFCSLYAAAASSDHEVFVVAMILFFAVLLPAIQYMAIPILQAKNMHRYKAFINLGTVIANGIISVPLSLMFGPVGAAIGTLIANVIGQFILNRYFHEKVGLNMNYFWHHMVRITRGFLLPLLCVLMIHYVVRPDSLISMVLAGALIVLVYGVSVLRYSMTAREQRVVYRFLKKVFGH